MSEPGVKITARGVFVDAATWAQWGEERDTAIAKADALDRTARTRPTVSRDDLKAQITALAAHNEELLRELDWFKEEWMRLQLTVAEPCPQCEEAWMPALRVAA